MKPERPYRVEKPARPSPDMWRGPPWNMKAWMVSMRIYDTGLDAHGNTPWQALLAGARQAHKWARQLLTEELRK